MQCIAEYADISIVVLVVDDYEDSGRALCFLLRAEGIPSEWKDCGAKALAAIRSHPADQPLLVILDYMMPGMNGLDVLQAIRSDPQIHSTPVILWSASMSHEQEQRAIALGAKAWIIKAGGRGGSVESTLETIVASYRSLMAKHPADGSGCTTRAASTAPDQR